MHVEMVQKKKKIMEWGAKSWSNAFLLSDIAWTIYKIVVCIASIISQTKCDRNLVDMRLTLTDVCVHGLLVCPYPFDIEQKVHDYYVCVVHLNPYAGTEQTRHFSNENINSSLGSYLSQYAASRLVFFRHSVGRLNNLEAYWNVCICDSGMHLCVCSCGVFSMISCIRTNAHLVWVTLFLWWNMSPFHFGLMHKRVFIHFYCTQFEFLRSFLFITFSTKLCFFLANASFCFVHRIPFVWRKCKFYANNITNHNIQSTNMLTSFDLCKLWNCSAPQNIQFYVEEFRRNYRIEIINYKEKEKKLLAKLAKKNVSSLLCRLIWFLFSAVFVRKSKLLEAHSSSCVVSLKQYIRLCSDFFIIFAAQNKRSNKQTFENDQKLLKVVQEPMSFYGEKNSEHL